MSYVFSGLQVDGLLFGSGINLRSPVRVATVANGTLASAFANGQTVDGIVLVTGDRILLKDQTTGTENGVYTVNASGAPTRAEDEIALDNASADEFTVTSGTVNKGTKWICTNVPGADIVSSNSLIFARAGGAGTVAYTGSAVDNQFVRYDGTSGLIQGSTWVTDDTGNVTGAGSITFDKATFDLTLQAQNQATAAGTVTIPDVGGVAGDVVINNLAQTLSAKTLNTPTINGNVLFEEGANDLTLVVTAPTVGAVNATIPDLAGVSSTFVFDTLAQTLTNKTLTDSTTFLQDNLDNTKKLQLQLSTITTGTTRTLTVPDASTTIVGTDVAQTLTNKTLTSPTMSSNIVFDKATNDVSVTATDQTTGASTANIPNLGGTTQDFVFTALAQTISNKTLGTNLDAGNFKIVNLATPTTALDAVNKAYVDSVASGLDPKESCRVATTAALPGATYTVAGPDTLTGITLTSIDGVALVVGNRVLVKNQADAKQNGIYTVTALPGGTTTNLTRASDQDGSPAGEVSAGNYTFIEQGTANQDTGWVLQGNGVLTLNTDNLNWTLFTVSGTVIAGNGLSKTGNTLDVNTTSVTTGISSDNVIVRSTGTANQVMRSTGTAGAEAAWGTVALADTNAVSGTLTVPNGGTGGTTFTSGNLLQGNGTSAITATAIATSTILTTTNTQTVSNKTFIDNSTLIADDGDNTKLFRFEASGITTATTRVLTVPDASTTIVGTDVTQTLSNKTLTAPRFADLGFIADPVGLAMLIFDQNATAVNNFQISNAATTTNPTLSVVGTDTNVGLDIQTKGTGQVRHLGTATQQAKLALREQTTNGTNQLVIQTPAALTADWTLTLPPDAGSSGFLLRTDGAGVTTWVSPPAARVSYKWLNSQVSVTSTVATIVAYHAWANSTYSDLGTTMRVVMWAAGMTNRDLVVTVHDGGASIGTTTVASGSANGIYTFTCTKPTSDKRLELRVNKSAAGGISPSIFGLQLEFTA